MDVFGSLRLHVHPALPILTRAAGNVRTDLETLFLPPGFPAHRLLLQFQATSSLRIWLGKVGKAPIGTHRHISSIRFKDDPAVFRCHAAYDMVP